MSRRRQKHKSKKRLRSWHRGKAEARRAIRALDRLPDVGTGADPTTGAPNPFRPNHPPRRGETI